MKISVVMTTYNGEKYVEEQLDSIRVQLLGRETVVAGIAVIVVHLISPRYSSWSLSENHCGVQEELAADILLPRGCSA